MKELGVKKGDVVCIYMPMVPEAAYAMLATTRLGAIHSVVFAGFSAESVRDRINDNKAKVVVTADFVSLFKYYIIIIIIIIIIINL